jgi:hypothetical protein
MYQRMKNPAGTARPKIGLHTTFTDYPVVGSLAG